MPRITERLTELKIKKAPKQTKQYKLYDQGGLLLLVRPSGSKVWQYPYKFDGKYNTYTIGQYPTVTMVEARNTLEEIKKLLDQGKRPVNPVYRYFW